MKSIMRQDLYKKFKKNFTVVIIESYTGEENQFFLIATLNNQQTLIDQENERVVEAIIKGTEIEF